MKVNLFAFALLGTFLIGCSETDKNSAIESSQNNIVNAAETKDEATDKEFDQDLANKYGADEYGMKPYIMAILKDGPNEETDPVKANELQAAHMENIRRMAEEGTLVVAGPFYGDAKGDHRGIYIFNVETIEEAEALTNTDPAVQAGTLSMELRQFYCSAALMAVNDLHDKITKTHF